MERCKEMESILTEYIVFFMLCPGKTHYQITLFLFKVWKFFFNIQIIWS